MNGNTPYAGLPGVAEAGHRAAADVPDLTSDQKRVLRRQVSHIAARTRQLLPDEYAVGSEVRAGTNGPEATVAVRPPVGHPVSAGFTPQGDDLDDGFDAAASDEVARGLAASAALQVKQAADGGGFTQTAR